jgi:hypothetical protein
MWTDIYSAATIQLQYNAGTMDYSAGTAIMSSDSTA